MTEAWPVPQKLFPVNGIGDILRKFVRVILLTDTTQMGTSTWFLITLLAISLLHATVCLAAHGLEPGKKRAVLGGLFLLMAGVAQFVRLPGTAWTFLRCFCYSYLTFLLGVGIRELDLKFLEMPLCAALSFALLAVMAPYYYIDLANVYIPGVLPYLAGVLGGWSMLKYIAGRLALREHLSRVWIYLGRHTIPVICLHVLCFKAVTWLYIRVRGLPAIYLASFHIDFDAGEGWKLLYLAAGLGGSLLLAAAWHSLVRCICQRSVRS
jgi:fucose 4-O-acetylase-like acetyltransferase